MSQSVIMIVLALILFLTVLYLMLRKKTLKRIPGPDVGSLLLGHAPLVNFEAIHRNLADWSRMYGPVYKLRLLHKHAVVVSGQEALHEMLVQKGVQTGGRTNNFRLKYAMEDTGILRNLEPDAKWKALRKLTQKHLKQFGDGMSRLEQLIASVGDDMLEDFRLTQGAPCDPKKTMLLTVMKNISFLLTGQRVRDGDPILDLFERVEDRFQYIIALNQPALMVYDCLPWLRLLRLNSWRPIEDLVDARDRLWERIKQVAMDNPANSSLAGLLLSHISCNEGKNHANLREMDANITCTIIITAAVATTVYTSHALINLLAHNRNVQESIYQEACRVRPDGSLVTLQNKPHMPYTTATILETLRYVSTTPMGVPHSTVSDVEISGYVIPKHTLLITNLWALHHDPDVWGDPERFRPERFLDDDGHLVPADHIYRKNLMPFGAGTRVCVGESLAITRLFMWIARLIQRFRIAPAEGNDRALTYVENYTLNALLLGSKPYSVHFSDRT